MLSTENDYDPNWRREDFRRYAAARRCGVTGLLELLLCAGSNPSLKNHEGETALDMADSCWGRTKDALLEARKQCSLLLRACQAAPSATARLLRDGETVEVSFSHRWKRLFENGAAEYEVRDARPGFPSTTWKCKNSLKLRDEAQGIYKTRRYKARVRLLSRNDAFSTAYSQWTVPVLVPPTDLVHFLSAIGKAEDGLLQHVHAITSMPGLQTLHSFTRAQWEEHLRAESSMQFFERRLLYEAIEKSHDQERAERPLYERLREKAHEEEELRNVAARREEHRQEMMAFIRRHGMEEEESAVLSALRLVATSIKELLLAYASKSEFLDDVAEAAPHVKPATRRRIWQAMQEERQRVKRQSLRDAGLPMI